MREAWTRLLMSALAIVVLFGLSLLRGPAGEPLVHPPAWQPQPVRIVRFFATTGALFAGEKAKLCYSVENARIVRLSPVMDRIPPSPGRCIEIHPDHTTHYTLQAEGFDGRIAVRSLTVPVQRLPLYPLPLQQVGWTIPR
ncbi:MAG: hypothetical protein KGN36_10165 [Acidobacteriota bacterium]|nr:hypothetical protein [Acidobacteriota bacterium]